MKRIFFALMILFFAVSAGFANASSNDEDNKYVLYEDEERKKFSYDLSIELAIPIFIDEDVIPYGVTKSMMGGYYFLLNTMFHASFQYTFVSVSDFLNIGFGVDVYQNPLTIFDNENNEYDNPNPFLGGIGLGIYNDMFINEVALSPFVRSSYIFGFFL